MFIQSKMVTFLVMIFLSCSAIAKENEKCDRVQFSINDQDGINISQNFTKQKFKINKQPVYYSFKKTQYQLIQTLIWWNNENNT